MLNKILNQWFSFDVTTRSLLFDVTHWMLLSKLICVNSILRKCLSFTQFKSSKKIAKKIKIDAQICGHDKAVFWESFQKCKHVNKLLM